MKKVFHNLSNCTDCKVVFSNHIKHDWFIPTFNIKCCKCWTNVDDCDCFMLAGVGPMTVAMLMNNTVDSAKRALQMQKVSPTLRMGFSLAPLFPYLRRFLRKWYFTDVFKLLWTVYYEFDFFTVFRRRVGWCAFSI